MNLRSKSTEKINIFALKCVCTTFRLFTAMMTNYVDATSLSSNHHYSLFLRHGNVDSYHSIIFLGNGFILHSKQGLLRACMR